MRRILFPVLGTALALALSSCVVVIPYEPDAEVNATASRQLLDTVNLAPNETFVYEIDATLVRNPTQMLVVSLDKNIRLTVRRSNLTVYAIADDETHFAGTESMLAASGGSLDRAAIVVSPLCPGACVQRHADVDTVFAEVRNNSGVSVDVGLYAWVEPFGDVEDRVVGGNDSLGEATDLAIGDTPGAIEVIGDIDFWWPLTDGTVELSPPDGTLRFRVDRYRSGVVQTFVPLEAIPVLSTDKLAVYLLDGRAAHASKSDYNLFFY